MLLSLLRGFGTSSAQYPTVNIYGVMNSAIALAPVLLRSQFGKSKGGGFHGCGKTRSSPAEKRESIAIPPLLAGAGLIGGVALMLLGKMSALK